MARPIPWAEPVTSADRPSRKRSCIIISLGSNCIRSPPVPTCVEGPLIRRPAENRYPDDEGMKHEAERQIEDGSAYQRDDVAAAPADRNRRRAGIGAALERDPIVDRPGEKGAEQHDRSEIAIGNKMRRGPGLHTDQHRMLKLAPDVAAGIGRNHADAGRPQQNLRDVDGPPWRIPDVDPVARAVLAEAVAD